MSDLQLVGKKVLLISPQQWSPLRVSKHHYAIALASLGNQVYFLNPPDRSVNGIEVTPSEVPGIQLVSYYPFFPIALRFKFKRVFQTLMSWQIRKIMQAINAPIDIVWCFDPYLYHNLRHFNAPTRIFHPVDVFKNADAQEVAASAQVLFSVSPSILELFKSTGKPSYFVNHGLGETFESIATSTLVVENQGKNICYVGNLLIPYMDRHLLKSLIEFFPDKQFHFIGPFESSTLGGGDEESTVFITFLKSCGNVVLHGPKNNTDMCRIMEGMDAFILCYTGRKEGYDLSNSHKILEYLSTGKPVISTPIKAYTRYRHLLSMPPDDMAETDYIAFFSGSIIDLEKLATPALSIERKNFALENTYIRQVTRISEILTRLKLI